MSHQLVNRSPDLTRLINEGYEVEIRGAYLLIGHIPYVNPNREIQYGTLVSELNLIVDRVGPPNTHVSYFIGAAPCYKDGRVISQIVNQTQTLSLMPGLVIQHVLSNKPDDGYRDYHHKMTRYIEMISAQAQSLDASVSAITFRVIESPPEESVFKYRDTNSTRAEIESITAKLKGLKIGIVGLGGTGGYVLDLVTKTPVDEIHLFDGDFFAQHNAFRAPGAPAAEQLMQPYPKVNYFTEIYSKMRRGIYPHAESINAANVSKLANMDFVFICVDDGPSKGIIVNFLELNIKSFVDVGMGINVFESSLIGILRATTSTPEERGHLRKLVSFDEDKDDDYSSNIQIADLNMLNAALAVIKWKKLCGFYQDLNSEHNSTYSINVNMLLSD